MNSRIMFLRDTKGHPVGCVAINVDLKNHRLSYQMSTLNPCDRFDRKLARHLALGRLVEIPIKVSLPRNKLSCHEISMAVMIDLATSNAPSRMVKAAQQWIIASKKLGTTNSK